MNVIIFKSLNTKAIIGFGNNLTEFAKNWLSIRSQYTIITETEKRISFTNAEGALHSIYSSPLRDGETCWISCDDNLDGFNDNH